MQIKDKVLLITGANRGIGKALVESALAMGAKKVYATARKLEDLTNFGDDRVVALQLDITQQEQVKKAAARATDVQILINNAGVLKFASVLEGSWNDLQDDMNVNYFGTLNITRAFVPILAANSGGAIANISSIIGLASMAGLGGYSASKAALFSATQAMRTELKSKKISVHGIFPGPIDTDMARSIDLPKTSASVTADNILKAIAAGQEDIFPDAMSANLGKLWLANPKGLEQQFAAM